MSKGSSIILRLYFAVVSAVTLFTLMFGAIDFLTIGLKSYVFTSADMPSYLINCDGPDAKYQFGTTPVTRDGGTVYEESTPEEAKARCEAANATSVENYEREKADRAVRNLALIIVSLPLFILHFRVVYRDWNNEQKSK